MLTKLPNLLTLSRIAVIPLMVGTFYLPEGTRSGSPAGCSPPRA